MNREIKYKAYIEVKEKQNFYDGDKVKLIDKKISDVNEIYWCNGEISHIRIKNSPLEIHTIFSDYCNIKLLQYTGLKDKNNKEVYEGDIVCANDEKCIISWHLGGWILNKVNKSDYVRLFISYLTKRENKQYYSDDIEIIGNIYENKELLEDA